MTTEYRAQLNREWKMRLVKLAVLRYERAVLRTERDFADEIDKATRLIEKEKN